MPQGALQCQRHGNGRGGRDDLGEGAVPEAGGVGVSRRFPSHLRLCLLRDSGPGLPVGAGSVLGQHRKLPALLLLLLEPSREQTGHRLVPLLQRGKLLEFLQADEVLNQEYSSDKEPEDSRVPYLPMTAQ